MGVGFTGKTEIKGIGMTGRRVSIYWTKRIFQRVLHKKKFPTNTQPRGGEGTGDVPSRFSYIPNVKQIPQGTHPEKTKCQ